ncbi:hypothetical protein BVIET440_10289 [Burkholderia vietnamiensis]
MRHTRGPATAGRIDARLHAHHVGAPCRAWRYACATGRKTPLWAESDVVGSAAAPGDAGEALVGQTSSSGVRLSDFAYYISLRSGVRFFMQSPR